MAFASLGSALHTAQATTKGPDDNTTIPPPGGTLPANGAGIKLIHLSAYSTNLPISAQVVAGSTVAQYNNLDLGQATTGYLNVVPGPLTVNVTPSSGPILSLTETVAANTNYTFAMIGGAKGWPREIWPLVDSTTKPAALTGKVRIVHAAPFGIKPTGNTLPVNTQVNIVTQSGESIDSTYEGLLYRESTPFITLPAGTHDWKVVLPTGAVLIDLPQFTIYSEAVLTLYIIGDGVVQGTAGLLVINELGTQATTLYLPTAFW